MHTVCVICTIKFGHALTNSLVFVLASTISIFVIELIVPDFGTATVYRNIYLLIQFVVQENAWTQIKKWTKSKIPNKKTLEQPQRSM